MDGLAAHVCGPRCTPSPHDGAVVHFVDVVLGGRGVAIGGPVEDRPEPDPVGWQQTVDWHAGYEAGRAAGRAELDPDRVPRIRVHAGMRGIEFGRPLTEPVLLVPETHWPDGVPIVVDDTPPEPPACTCDARPGQGHLLMCARWQ